MYVIVVQMQRPNVAPITLSKQNLLSDLLQQLVIHHPQNLYMIALQMQGPNVAPFTLGKQNLLLHTLRQLEKNYFVDGQFFRLGHCSHDKHLQQANATVIIVRGTQAGNGGNGICLEKVSNGNLLTCM